MSKEIKQLKAFFRDLSEDEKAYHRTMRKLKAFEKWLIENIPFNIKGTYSFSPDLGEGCPRLFIYLNKDEDSTVTLVKWLPELKRKRFEIEKFWRKDDGYFAYRAQRNYPNGVNYIIIIEETANIDGCVIVEKEEMRKVYATDCENETVKL